MTFEWDENKNNINKEKHKISFETATQLATEAERRVYYDQDIYFS